MRRARRSSESQCTKCGNLLHTTPSPSIKSSLDLRPHFFKLIVNPAIQMNQLRLPRKFVSKEGKSIRNRVKLRVPDDKVWRAEIWRDGQDVWFAKGWDVFVSYYSVRHGNFLLFRYDGLSEFQVQIFDLTCCEIKYDHMLSRNVRPPVDDYGVENEGQEFSIELQHSAGKSKKVQGTTSTRNNLMRSSPSSNVYPCSEDPRRFSIFMSESYVTKLCLAAVPATGKTEHMINYEKGKKRMLYLHGPDGKIIPVSRYYDIRKSQVRLRLHDFVNAYNVKEGDECRFELIEGTRDSYKVSIRREHG